ncbi:MAG: inorganic pyrophosphatase [Candidatus Latescibacteria bacterium]|nr:inorganic pyrophosphatase [Candidatus Latescibacterota bacterium]
MVSESFWTYLENLIAQSQVVIDRPKGSAHPRYPEVIYPLDYGYLEGTSSGDGEGVDLWRGSNAAGQLDAIVCTVDAVKRDVEIKLLVGCTAAEKAQVMAFHGGGQGAMLVERD